MTMKPKASKFRIRKDGGGKSPAPGTAPEVPARPDPEEQVAAAAKAYRVVYQALDDDPEFYTVNHSAFSYITLPGTGFVDFVRRDEPPEAVAERMACFVRAAGQD